MARAPNTTTTNGRKKMEPQALATVTSVCSKNLLTLTGWVRTSTYFIWGLTFHMSIAAVGLSYGYVGYSIRSDTWRYTLHVKWDGSTLQPIWDSVVTEELYDHARNDPRTFDGQTSEPVNLLGLGPDIEPSSRDEANRLKTLLIQHFSSDS